MEKIKISFCNLEQIRTYSYYIDDVKLQDLNEIYANYQLQNNPKEIDIVITTDVPDHVEFFIIDTIILFLNSEKINDKFISNLTTDEIDGCRKYLQFLGYNKLDDFFKTIFSKKINDSLIQSLSKISILPIVSKSELFDKYANIIGNKNLNNIHINIIADMAGSDNELLIKYLTLYANGMNFNDIKCSHKLTQRYLTLYANEMDTNSSYISQISNTCNII